MAVCLLFTLEHPLHNNAAKLVFVKQLATSPSNSNSNIYIYDVVQEKVVETIDGKYLKNC